LRACGRRVAAWVTIEDRVQPEDESICGLTPLASGHEHPFDWGFIPGTRAADGDRVDALVLNDVPTHPGVVIACRPIGMVELLQTEGGAEAEINNRVVLLPELPEATVTVSRE
jgi:inorganic pyrophosphatase